MKKIVSILLAVLVVISMFAFTASAAVSAPTITATANASTAKVGDTVKVTVSTSKNSKICAATLSLEYNPEYFQVVNKTDAGAFAMVEFREPAGAVSFFAISNSCIGDAATALFTVEFKVLKTGGQIKLVAKELYVLDNKGTADNKDDDEDVNMTSKIAPVTISFGCPHANKEDKVTTAPTCTAAGVKTTTCKDCGATVGTSAVPAAGHKFADATVTKEPTCTEKGLKEGKCTVCDAVTQEEIPVKAHDYEVKVTDPTCTEKGLKESTCKACNATVKEEIPTVAHKYGEKIVVTAATATKDGKFKTVCSECGHEKFGVINKTGTSKPGTSQPGDLNDPNTGVSLTFAFAAAGLALATGTVVRRKRK